MKRSERIGALADLEQHTSDQAARRLAESQRLLHERETVLAELHRYRDEYLNGRQYTPRRSIVAFQDYQRFLGRLDEAIECQGRLVAESARDCDARHGEWLAARSRAVSLEQAVERCARVERRGEARREQQRLDEAASRAGGQGFTGRAQPR